MHRAAYWRTLGFPDLVLARQARWRGYVKKSDRPWRSSSTLPTSWGASGRGASDRSFCTTPVQRARPGTRSTLCALGLLCTVQGSRILSRNFPRPPHRYRHSGELGSEGPHVQPGRPRPGRLGFGLSFRTKAADSYSRFNTPQRCPFIRTETPSQGIRGPFFELEIKSALRTLTRRGMSNGRFERRPKSLKRYSAPLQTCPPFALARPLRPPRPDLRA